MERFKNILVATSPGHLDPPTLRAAVDLAEINKARLTVVDVVAPIPAWRRKMNVEGRVIDVEAAILRDREERLRHLLGNTRGGSDVEVVETVGEPFIEVIRRVLDHAHDLVVVEQWCDALVAQVSGPGMGDAFRSIVRRSGPGSGRPGPGRSRFGRFERPDHRIGSVDLSSSTLGASPGACVGPRR